jgi:hypothetical protein
VRDRQLEGHRRTPIGLDAIYSLRFAVGRRLEPSTVEALAVRTRRQKSKVSAQRDVVALLAA